MARCLQVSPQLIRVTELDLLAVFVVLVDFREFFMQILDKEYSLLCCELTVLSRTDRPRSLRSTNCPFFWISWEPGTAKMAMTGVTTLSFTMAPQKPMGDVTETASIFCPVYG